MVRGVRGLADNDICSATIEQPSAGTDECLARNGRGGRITRTGRATASPETVSRVRMHRVDTINGRPLAAIAAEDAPGRPLAAAELYRRANGGLERYARIAARERIDGRLKDVNRGGAPAEAYATINDVDGLDRRQFCMARLPEVDTQTEELLKSIGRGGRIRLTVSCSARGGRAGGRADGPGGKDRAAGSGGQGERMSATRRRQRAIPPKNAAQRTATAQPAAATPIGEITAGPGTDDGPEERRRHWPPGGRRGQRTRHEPAGRRRPQEGKAAVTAGRTSERKEDAP